jgi:hypothetical protein
MRKSRLRRSTRSMVTTYKGACQLERQAKPRIGCSSIAFGAPRLPVLEVPEGDPDDARLRALANLASRVRHLVTPEGPCVNGAGRRIRRFGDDLLGAALEDKVQVLVGLRADKRTRAMTLKMCRSNALRIVGSGLGRGRPTRWATVVACAGIRCGRS